MMLFLGGLAILLVALAAIWLPFLQKKNRTILLNQRQRANSQVYQQQIAVVEKQFNKTDPVLKSLRNELALGLLTEEECDASSKSEAKSSLLLPTLMTLFIIPFTVIVYSQLGNYAKVEQYHQQQQDDPFAELTQQEITDTRLLNLLQKIKENPQESENWFILTEYYLYHNEFDNALIALGKVSQLDGETIDVLAAKAMVLYYQNGQRINEPVQTVLDNILEKEPLQPTALMIVASDYYYQARYQDAITIWQKLLDSNNPQIDRIMLIERINTAKMMANR